MDTFSSLFPIFILFEFVSKYLLLFFEMVIDESIDIMYFEIFIHFFSKITNIWQTILHIGKSFIGGMI